VTSGHDCCIDASVIAPSGMKWVPPGPFVFLG
jgi:hypothetical protein